MKYIDLYKNQLEQNSHDNDLYESQYYLEYCKLNCFLNDFQRSHTYIKDLIIGDIDLLSKMETDRINQSISLLKKQMTKLPKAFQEILDSIELWYSEDCQGLWASFLKRYPFLVINQLLRNKIMKTKTTFAQSLQKNSKIFNILFTNSNGTLYLKKVYVYTLK